MIASAAENSGPGRSCPLHYRYRPEVFASPARPELQSLDVLYVVGGLYGNELALERVLDLFATEPGRKRLVFNGDFHWFDIDPEVFARIQSKVLAHTAMRGNVETELATPPAEGESDPGCGCAYPAWVGEDIVIRSNRILARLRQAITASQRCELESLPMWLRADVGDMRIGIVHGDAESLAGWAFAQEHLSDPGHRDRIRGCLSTAGVDAFACSHTCLPVFQSLWLDAGAKPGWILNNGAAGMPNFAGDHAGLLTRIALSPPSPGSTRAGVRHGVAYIDALAIEVDEHESRRRFLRQWPPGSDAHASYFDRLATGPAYSAQRVIRQETSAPS